MSEVEPTRQESAAAIEALRQSPSRKKRTAERQITQDDNDLDDDDASPSDGLTKNGHPRASAEVMKTRRIVKPRRPPSISTAAKATKSSETKPNNSTEPTSEEPKDEDSNVSDPQPKNNPFASVALTKPDTTSPPKPSPLGTEKSATDAPKPSIFGSLTTSTTTPSTTTSATTTITKPLFGSSTTTSVFGQSTTTPSTGFGSVGTNKFTFATVSKSSASKPFTFATVTGDSASTGSSFFGKSATTTEPKTNGSETPETSTPPPLPIVIKNGEEDESCTFQMRVKLFRFVEVRPKPGVEVDSGGPAVASVPPSNNVGSTTTKKKEDTKEDEKQNTEKEDGATGSTGEGDNDDVAKKKMEWKEVGIGPLRVLEKKVEGDAGHEKDKRATENDSDDKATTSTVTKSKRGLRLVQRRECTPGGQGTKLILNLPLQKGCHVLRKGDKFVRLSAFEPEEQKEGEKKEVTIRCVQYLFKTKTVVDADSLQEVLQKGIDDCGK